MQFLAFGLIVTAGLFIRGKQCEPPAAANTSSVITVNVDDQAEKIYLDKCRGLIKVYVDRLNKKNVTIVLDEVTKWADKSGTLYYCAYTVNYDASKSKICYAYVSFEKITQVPTLIESPCFL